MVGRDSNGDKVRTSVVRCDDGTWSAMVYWGCHNVTDVREQRYDTREAARAADLSDGIGRNGRLE